MSSEKFLVANIKATLTFFDNSTGVAKKRIEEGEEMEEYNTSAKYRIRCVRY